MSLVLAGAVLMSPQPVSDAEPTLTSTERLAIEVSTVRVERPPPAPVAQEPELPEPPPEQLQDDSGADWVAIAQCESEGRWELVTTGNGYYFALQFDPDTWTGFGGDPAYLDGPAPSMALQISVAERVLAVQGPLAWPNCFVSN